MLLFLHVANSGGTIHIQTRRHKQSRLKREVRQGRMERAPTMRYFKGGTGRQGGS